MDDESESFDTVSFIESVYRLPCIWDYTSDAYSNRVERSKAWELICSKFCDNYEKMEKDEKYLCSVNLQRRWRSLRDSYTRELRIKKYTKKTGFKASKRRKYLYFDNLFFLKALSRRRRVSESPNNDSTQRQNEYSSEDEQDGPTNKKNNRKKKETSQKKTTSDTNKQTELMEKLLNHLSAQTSAKEPKDGDLHFLMSLHDRFKAIDDHLKMDAQIEILNVIKKYSSPPPQLSGPVNVTILKEEKEDNSQRDPFNF